jgi:hypothetical protein
MKRAAKSKAVFGLHGLSAKGCGNPSAACRGPEMSDVASYALLGVSSRVQLLAHAYLTHPAGVPDWVTFHPLPRPRGLSSSPIPSSQFPWSLITKVPYFCGSLFLWLAAPLGAKPPRGSCLFTLRRASLTQAPRNIRSLSRQGSLASAYHVLSLINRLRSFMGSPA